MQHLSQVLTLTVDLSITQYTNPTASLTVMICYHQVKHQLNVDLWSDREVILVTTLFGNRDLT